MEGIITQLQTVDSLGHSSCIFLFCSLIDCPLGNLCICPVSRSQTATNSSFYMMTSHGCGGSALFQLSWRNLKCGLSLFLSISANPKVSESLSNGRSLPRLQSVYHSYHSASVYMRFRCIHIELALILVIHALCLCHLCYLKPHKCHSWPYFATVTFDQVCISVFHCIGNVKLWCKCVHMVWMFDCMLIPTWMHPPQHMHSSPQPKTYTLCSCVQFFLDVPLFAWGYVCSCRAAHIVCEVENEAISGEMCLEEEAHRSALVVAIY